MAHAAWRVNNVINNSTRHYREYASSYSDRRMGAAKAGKARRVGKTWRGMKRGEGVEGETRHTHTRICH